MKINFHLETCSEVQRWRQLDDNLTELLYSNDGDDNDETQAPSLEKRMDEDNDTEEDGAEISSNWIKELKPNVLWFENSYVVRAVTKCIVAHFEHPCTCWKNADEEEKEMWWDMFKARFEWSSDIDDDVREEFEKTAARRLRDIVYKAMKSKKCPIWMSKEVRKIMRKMRQTTEFKKRSTQASKNKKGLKKGIAHTQGSVSTRELMIRYYNAHSKVLTAAEMFEKTHMKKDGNWVDDKAKEVWEKYQNQAGEPFTKEDDDAYLEAAGGINKDGSVYGIGNLSEFYYPLSDLSKISKELPSSNIVLQLQNQFRDTQQELKFTQDKFEEYKKHSENDLKVTQDKFEEYKKLSEDEKIEFKSMMMDMKTEMARMSQVLNCSDYSIKTPDFA